MELTGNTTEKPVYKAVVEQAQLPMAQVEGSGHVVSAANTAFCRLLNKPPEEIIGKPLADLVPLGVECLSLVDNVYRTGEPVSQVRTREDHSNPVYWSYTCLPVKGESNEALGVVLQVTETPLFSLRNAEINQALLVSSVRQHELATEAELRNNDLRAELVHRRQEEDRLRRKRDTFMDLVNKAPFGLYVLDKDLNMYQVSAGSQKLFNNVDPIIGRPFKEVLELILPESVAAELLVHFRHTLSTGEPYVAPVFSEQLRNSRERDYFDWKIERITLPDGNFGVVCYFYDITEQQRIQDQLREADKRKSEFLATLAHELRNPLAPLRNGLDLLAVSQGDPATWDQAHEMMKRQLDQMVRLIDELLDLSRITRGTVDLQMEHLDLRAVLSQALDTCRFLIDQQGHRLVLDMPPTPLMVDGDSLRLIQVFSNLLNNAVKYTDRGGTITVRAETGDGEASVSFADTGIGISRDDLGRVFDMFAQVQQTTDRSQGGLGIGLNIVKHLVKLHHGRVAVTSGGPGKGSCFTLHLPLSTTAEVQADKPEVPVATAKCAHKRVLIVDDNVDAATMMALLLGKWGHEVHLAHDGAEALVVGAAILPDIVLMDIGMPVMDGHTACTNMRRSAWGAAAFIVALTGWGQDEDKLRSLQAGFDHHLVKPVSKDALSSILSMADARVGS